MKDTKKTCAKCKHLLCTTESYNTPYQEISCPKVGWDGVEHIDDLYEPVDCEYFEEV